MGGEKPLLPFGERTLIEWVASRCAPHPDRVLVSTSGASMSLPDERWHVVPDQYSGRGPLAGVHALLASCPTPWLLVIPCDMPRLMLCHLENLLAAAQGSLAACYALGDVSHPFPLALHMDVCGAIERRLEENLNKVLGVFDDVESRRVEAADLLGEEGPACLENVNTPGDLDRARAAFFGAS